MNGKTKRSILDKLTQSEVKKNMAFKDIEEDRLNNAIHFLLQSIQFMQEAVFKLQAVSAKLE